MHIQAIIPPPHTVPVTDSESGAPGVPNPLSTRLLCAVAWIVGLSVLIITSAAFTVLGYAVFSISTIPDGHALSVFYASLIGGTILIPPVCIACDAAFKYNFPSGYSKLDMASFLWVEYVPRALIIPVCVGGGALGLKILEMSPFDQLVDKGHFVAASALGGLIFQVIYEMLRAAVVIMTLIREGGERIQGIP
ncbi:hypothetical protein BDZ89DRAFT_1141600 [Hymenopellis radicata]|nr:hypothetical protein BDZ89DRAFT_1141600 [Hymenopellis radicata]